MTGLAPFEYTLIAAVILAALEVVTGTFIVLGFAVGCCAVALAEFLGGGFNVYRDVMVFAAIASLAIVALRLTFARPGDTARVKGDVNDY
jgi:membrane protein implicated in regulation of membrane protease activity